MPFLRSFFVSVSIAAVLYYSSMAALLDAPVKAEYWVQEMLFVKKELVKSHSGKPKLIIAGGSSALIGIDAEYAANRLNMPVINFGLHAGLPLERILKEAASVVEPGDYLILQLEPPYYECPKELNSWQIRNMIAWDHESMKALGRQEKLRLFFSIPPSLYQDMLISGIKRKFYPSSVNERTSALDRSAVLSKFRSRTISYDAFSYSANQLDDYGDLQAAIGSNFKLKGRDVRKPDRICVGVRARLREFTDRMRAKGISVYFANTPYMASEADREAIDRSEKGFLEDLAPIGCLIDRRQGLLLDRKYFFDSNLHLNTEGRRIRTQLLIDAVRNRVLPGKCG